MSVCGKCGTDARYANGNCIQCKKLYDTSYWKANRAKRLEQHRAWSETSLTVERNRAYGKNWRTRVKKEAFEAYGGCFCVGCGEDEMAVLSIDHTNGKGADHRRLLAKERNVPVNWPPGFRVLCMN